MLFYSCAFSLNLMKLAIMTEYNPTALTNRRKPHIVWRILPKFV